MDTGSAQTAVKVYAVLSWLAAAYALFMAILILGAGSIAIRLSERFFGAGILGGVGIVLAIVLLAIALFNIFVGIGVWRHRPWARVAMIVISVINLLSFPIGTIIGAFGIYLFGFNENVKRLFA